MSLIALDAAGGDRLAEVGAKAARLGELIRAGFPVPAGVVLPVGGDAALAAGARAALGEGPLAVRSSATIEDGEISSRAGLFDSVLDVRDAGALASAVQQVLASASAPRVAAHLAKDGAPVAMAVLIQQMLAVEAAGVAFTADPLTGAREVVVVAAPAPADVVSGQGAGHLLAANLRQQIVELALRIENHFGAPQDIEWAIAGGRVFVLQSRPMTALPAVVSWAAPHPGAWLRHFRLGEQLGEPPTPLFLSWLIRRVEEHVADANRALTGFRPRPPHHVLVNGWYYSSPFGAGGAELLLGSLVRRPRFLLAVLAHQSRPEWIDRWYLEPLVAAWRKEVAPRYRELVRRGESAADVSGPASVRLVDDLVDAVAAYFWSVIMGGGSAWKIEGVLAAFCRRHLGQVLLDGHQVLLGGLRPAPALPPAHAVFTLDWFHPTWGELGSDTPTGQSQTVDDDAFTRAHHARNDAEAACRARLGSAERARFDLLLEMAQRHAVLREEQAAELPLAWPLLRRCLLGIGRDLARGGLLDEPEHVFFLERDELCPALAGQNLAERARGRRAEWERQRRLAAPLVVGRMPGFLRKMLVEPTEAMRTRPPGVGRTLVGMPASPGRAAGVARLVRTPADLDRVRKGDVLVASAPSPFLTVAFSRAVALVTDTGSVAAHASLVAREHGLPAVVATGDATRRLRDGTPLVVDGSAGVVSLPEW